MACDRPRHNVSHEEEECEGAGEEEGGGRYLDSLRFLRSLGLKLMSRLSMVPIRYEMVMAPMI